MKERGKPKKHIGKTRSKTDDKKAQAKHDRDQQSWSSQLGLGQRTYFASKCGRMTYVFCASSSSILFIVYYLCVYMCVFVTAAFGEADVLKRRAGGRGLAWRLAAAGAERWV